MKGNITRRGKTSWRLKYDVGRDPLSHERDIRYVTFRGNKVDAEKELRRLMSAADAGTDVRPDKMTVAEFLDRWMSDWAAMNVGGTTRERYGYLIEGQIRPYIGAMPIQKLRPVHLSGLYSKLWREGKGVDAAGAPVGLSARTVGHAHRLLHRALGHAKQWGVIVQNPAADVSPPPVEEGEVDILTADQVGAMLAAMKGRTLYPIVALALATGMRRGELLALRWKDVDLAHSTAAKLRVEQSLEQTKSGLRFKPPKTKHGRRTITLPVSAAQDLRALRIEQQKQRLALGAGRLPDDALVFPKLDGSPQSPNLVSTNFVRIVKSLDLPRVTFHALRHTHASALIAAGLDVLTISRRLGHGAPTITLTVYGHLFSNTDDRAAQAIEAAFKRAD